MIAALFRGFVVQRLIRAASNPRNQERARQAFRSARSSRGGGQRGGGQRRY